VVRIHSVKTVFFGLLSDDDCIPEADFLERLVPLKNAVGNRFAIFFGDVFVDPVGDRLLRLGQGGGGIFLFQSPAIDQVRLGFDGEIVGVIDARGDKMADTLVGDAGSSGSLAKL
jgi:hypothetical protein